MKTEIRIGHLVVITKWWERRGAQWEQVVFRWVEKSFDWVTSCPWWSCCVALECFPPCYGPFFLSSDILDLSSMSFLRSQLYNMVVLTCVLSQGTRWIREPIILLSRTQLLRPKCEEMVSHIICSAWNVGLWNQERCQDWWTLGTCHTLSLNVGAWLPTNGVALLEGR